MCTSAFGISQVSCISLLPDSSFIWKENRFFIHEYILVNQSHENIIAEIVDSAAFQSEVSVKYSIDNQFVENQIELVPGNNKFRVWIRYNRLLESKEIPFQLKNESFSYIDTIETFYLEPVRPIVHSQQTLQYLDYYSPEREKTELQLFDKLWNLVGVYDAKNERINLQAFSPGTYYLKANQEVFMIKKIDPNNTNPTNPHFYSTIDHKTNLTMDRSR